MFPVPSASLVLASRCALFAVVFTFGHSQRLRAFTTEEGPLPVLLKGNFEATMASDILRVLHRGHIRVKGKAPGCQRSGWGGASGSNSQASLSNFFI